MRGFVRENPKMEEMQSRYARRYDREFKENAVALVESGREVKEFARELGVSHWSLKQWCKRSKTSEDKILALAAKVQNFQKH